MDEFAELIGETAGNLEQEEDVAKLEKAIQRYVSANELLQARVCARMSRIGDKIDRVARIAFPVTYLASMVILFHTTLADKYSSVDGRGPDVYDVRMQEWIPMAYVRCSPPPLGKAAARPLPDQSPLPREAAW